MNDTIDLLQIKIEEARKNLSEDTKQAIDAVPWKASLLGMRESKGYSFEQLGDLEVETELLLCGLLNPEDYPKELEARMHLPKARVDELVNDMNQLVFTRIREELIKITERKNIMDPVKMPEVKPPIPVPPIPKSSAINPVSGREGLQVSASNGINKDELGVLDQAGIKIIGAKPNLAIPELKAAEAAQPAKVIPPILTQKFAGAFQMPTVKTEHAADTPKAPKTPAPKITYPKGADPYRLPPE